MKQCTGYNPGYQKCRFGFDQSNVCRGFLIGWKRDHDNPANIPQCCNDEVCGKLYNKTSGKPKVQANPLELSKLKKQNRKTIYFNDGFTETHFDGIACDSALCGHDLDGDNIDDHGRYKQAISTDNPVDCPQCLAIVRFCKNIKFKKAEKP